MTSLVEFRDPFELQPVSEAGRRLVALAEGHAIEFGRRAAQHDREATFPFENLDGPRASGVLAA
jgi:hypothetical protein